MEYLSGTLCVRSQPGLELAGQAKPCQSSCPPHQAGTEIGSLGSIWLGLERTRPAVLFLSLLPCPAVFVPVAQLHLAQPGDVGDLPAGSAGGRPPGLGPGMRWARPPPAPPWPGFLSSIFCGLRDGLVRSCSASPALVPASAAPACLPTSAPGFSFTTAATGGQRSAAGRFHRPVCLNSAPSHSAACYPSEADADIAGVERGTAGHTPGLGWSNLYEMCADHPGPPFPPSSVLLAPPTSTLPAPPHLSSLLCGNEVEFGSGGGAVSGGVVFEPLRSSGGGINKAVSATRQFYHPEDGLCGKADYVAGTTKPASNLTYCNTTDAKPQKDSNSANIRF